MNCENGIIHRAQLETWNQISSYVIEAFETKQLGNVDSILGVDWILSKTASHTVKGRHLNIAQRKCKWSSERKLW